MYSDFRSTLIYPDPKNRGVWGPAVPWLGLTRIYWVTVLVRIPFISEETMEIDSAPEDQKEEAKPDIKQKEESVNEDTETVEKVIEKELPKEDAILHYLGQLSW